MNTITKDINKQMQKGQSLILLNSEENQNPTYRMLLQTPNELPAQDMGYDSVTYNPETIKSKIKQLEGQFVVDETQTAHNKRKTPENKGHRFAQVVNTGYCPEYGAYGDITIFDSNYHGLMDQVYKSTVNGLRVHEGISTELDPIDAHVDGNNLFIDDWNYHGLVWDKNPRDKVGICKVLNSIYDVLEDKNMTDEFKIDREEYDMLKQAEADKIKLESEIAGLKAEKVKGKADWIKAEDLYNTVKEKADSLEEEIKPYRDWLATQKDTLVNSILETVKEADKDAEKAKLEKLGIDELGIIVNALPSPGAQRHGVTGGSGTGRRSNPDLTEDEKEEQAAQNMPSGQKRNLV